MKRILVILILINLTIFSMTAKEQIISNTLSFEGEKMYMNSMRGIELNTLKVFNKKNGTKWVLHKLTNNQAVIIAESLYWDDKLDYIHPEVAMSIFDYTFNSNPDKAYKRIHKLFKSDPKPYMTLELVAKINSVYKQDAIELINNNRLNYLKTLKSFKLHGKGWSKRVNSIKNFKIK